MIAIHGGGYVGLTAAVHYARAGLRTTVYDPDPAVVAGINAGRPKAGEFLGYLGKEWPPGLRATADITEVLGYECHVVCVPSERDGEPWMNLVLSVLEQIFGGRKKKGERLVIVESTLTPGTLGGWASSRPLELFHLAHAPRRDWFADPEKNLATLPRVVGGITPEATRRAVELIKKVSPNVLETDAATAELTKPLENAFLHAQVALANSTAVAYPHLDVARAVELACTHWRLMKVHLSAGTGGRCVPLGPRYLKKGQTSDRYPLVAHVVEYDDDMRRRITDAVHQRIDPSGDVLVLGIAYRPGFRDAGHSPGLGVAHELWKAGHRVSVADPMWDSGELTRMARLPAWGGDRIGDRSMGLSQWDAVVLATPHQEFRDLPPFKTKFFLDCQGAWIDRRDAMEAAGTEYARVGSPGWMR